MTKSETKTKKSKLITEKSVKELKIDLQKLVLDVRTGVEKNTSKVRNLRREIARKLTQINNTNK